MEIEYISPSFEEMLGHTQEEFRNVPWEELLRPRSLEKSALSSTEL